MIDLKDTCFIETGLMYFARGGEHVVDLLWTEEKHPFGYFRIFFFFYTNEQTMINKQLSVFVSISFEGRAVTVASLCVNQLERLPVVFRRLPHTKG